MNKVHLDKDTIRNSKFYEIQFVFERSGSFWFEHGNNTGLTIRNNKSSNLYICITAMYTYCVFLHETFLCSA